MLTGEVVEDVLRPGGAGPAGEVRAGRCDWRSAEALSSARATGWPGTRAATVSRAAVVSGGTCRATARPA